jgi:hypothetical protein
LSLVSVGNSDHGGAVDYVLKYEHPRSFLIGAAQSSFLIGDTKSLVQEAPPTINAQGKVVSDEQELLRQQRLEAPRWEGKELRVAVGRAAGTDERMTVTFSVLNSSPRTIELLPPQIQLAGTSKARHGKTIKSEPVAIKDYRMTARRGCSLWPAFLPRCFYQPGLRTIFQLACGSDDMATNRRAEPADGRA